MKSFLFKHFNISFKILTTPSETCRLFLSIHKTSIKTHFKRSVSKYIHVNGSSWEAPECVDCQNSLAYPFIERILNKGRHWNYL